MKLNKPIEIELLKFLLKGEFDCIKTGQTKEWILNNFPDPDSISNMGHNLYIWLYGNIEFHFEGDLLYMIYSDYLGEINAGDSIIINKWILNQYDMLNLLEVIRVLNDHKKDFTLIHDTTSQAVIVRILVSNVDLYFSSENTDDINLYHFMAFSLSHEGYRRNLSR